MGIEVLVRFFRDSDLFEWVTLESDDPDARSLDDIVALRRDGTVELVQVKFTVDEQRFPLDWDWLLAKTKRGTSLLAKWSSAFRRARSNGPVHSASLRTNRTPSPEFLAHLEGTLVRLDRLDPSLRTRVVAECGGEAEAGSFFGEFNFFSSLPDLDRLEVQLRDTLIPTDTDLGGWNLLRSHVRRWATYSAEPGPDGRIRHEHLVQLLSRKRPKPIRQDFYVPDGYVAPSESFDKAFFKRIVDRQTPLTVLWGTPGRGKSTYLSYFVKKLQSKGLVLRHHYFLSLHESSVDRTSYFDIANSMFHQMWAKAPEDSRGISGEAINLREDITLVAGRLSARGQRLFVIVDGLDHVWRDTHRIDQLDQLFNTLLPLPDNVSVIVGTQRVDDAQLPRKLLMQARRPDWIEIPPMDSVAVHAWVASQDSARPLLLESVHNDNRAEKIGHVAGAFWEISNGHPLHLIYAIESLRLREVPISVDVIRSTPPCPDGDIRDYYNSLWVTLAPDAKRILHALAGSQFAWPPGGVRRCFGDFTAVEFLLEDRPSGLMPFHGSIFAWVRERNDHATVFEALLPDIIAWLKSDAPAAWRWAWLWIAEARLGNSVALLAGATREWAVDSLAHGWHEDQIEEVFRQAEQIAFDQSNLAQTVAFRSIKTRVSNARDYQASDYGLFRACAIAISSNRQQARNLIDRLPELSDSDLVWLARLAPIEERNEVIGSCVEELARRITAWLALRNRQGRDFIKLVDAFVDCALLQGEVAVPRIKHFLSGFREPGPRFSRYIRGLGDRADFASLIRLRRELGSSRWGEQRRDIETQLLRAALRVGRAPNTVLARKSKNRSLLISAWLRLQQPHEPVDVVEPPIPNDLIRDQYYGEARSDIEQFFVDAFWLHVCRCKSGGEPVKIYTQLDRSAMGWMAGALSVLEDAALSVVEGRTGFGFTTLYEAASELAPVRFSNTRERDYHFFKSFRRSMVRIAIDLHLLSCAGRADKLISLADFGVARSSVHWSDPDWVSERSADGLALLTTDAALSILEQQVQALDSEVTEFMQRAAAWCELAHFAHLQKVGSAAALMRRSADCLLGYGYRKDLSAMEVLDAIAQVHRHDATQTVGWLKAVTPVIDQITEFTDGDETRHTRSELIRTVGATLPELLPAFHRHHIEQEDWNYADDALHEFVKQLSLEGPCARALASTLLDPGSLGILDKRNLEDPLVGPVLAHQIDFLGGQTPLAGKLPKDSEEAEAKKKCVTVGRYPPKRLAALLSTLSEPDISYEEKRTGLRRWLEYWETKGRAVEALAAMEAQLDKLTSAVFLDESLDVAFRISLANEGKEAAFRWLVRAHSSRYGWASYMVSEEETMSRLRMAAVHYRERWQDFIKDTATQSPYWARRSGHRSLVIGQKYLVRFLLLVGQVEKASAVTAALVESFVSEVQDQPIPSTKWLS